MVQINHVQTGVRKISKTKADNIRVHEPVAGTVATNESDTNADTCCLGKNFIVQAFTNRTVDVYSYDTLVAPTCNVPIVTGVTAWDCPDSNITYILVFNESSYYGEKLDHTLINPNQIRHNGIDYWDNPFDKSRGICIELDDGPTIKLAMDGTKVTFKSRAPSQHELNTCEHIEMTSSFTWEPHDVQLGEMNMRSVTDEIFSESDRFLHSINPSLIMLKEMSSRYIQTNTYIDVTAEDIPAR